MSRRTSRAIVPILLALTSLQGQTVDPPCPVKTVIAISKYPWPMRLAQKEGTADLVITISPQGDLAAVRALSGLPFFTDAATANLREWRFAPCPKSCELKVRYTFLLPDAEEPAGQDAPVGFELDLSDGIHVTVKGRRTLPVIN